MEDYFRYFDDLVTYVQTLQTKVQNILPVKEEPYFPVDSWAEHFATAGIGYQCLLRSTSH